MIQNPRFKIIANMAFVLVVAIFLGLILLTPRSKEDSSLEGNSGDSELTIHQSDALIRSILDSFGAVGYPERYTYDRPVSIIDYEQFDDSWMVVEIEILDEPPLSASRRISYIIKELDGKYETIASSLFWISGVQVPEGIPEIVENTARGGDI